MKFRLKFIEQYDIYVIVYLPSITHSVFINHFVDQSVSTMNGKRAQMQ